MTFTVTISNKTKTAKTKTHPTYFEMIKNAIMASKKRTGLSQYAISKHIEQEQLAAKHDLPGNFKKLLLIQLKRLVTFGKLVRVKNSFKLSPDHKKLRKLAAKAKKTETKAKPIVKKTKAVVKKSEKKVVKSGAIVKKKAIK